MSGLIGDKESAKFIFFAVDDESELPKKAEMLNHFPDCKYNVYKAWGHFRYTFTDLDGLLHIKRHGVEAGICWNSPRYISHAYRITTDCKPDSFFVMKYGNSLVGFYEISHVQLVELEKLLEYWRGFVELLEKMKETVKNFKLGKKAAALLDVSDDSMSNPDEEAIKQLFSKYGEQAAEQMVSKMKGWQTKVQWQ
jgi:hypothetical protein